MDTHSFWTAVALIVTALVVIAPLAHRSLGGPPHQRLAMHTTGVLAASSFAIGAGPVAAAMTLPWWCLGAALALRELRTIGVATLLRRPNLVVVGPLATWMWMAAGAGWLTAHRLGLAPLGFDRAITLLTAAHFHVAGLGLTALLLGTYRRRPSSVLLAAVWLHQVGMVTVAAGLTFDDRLEVAGAAMITVALGGWAVIVVGWARSGLGRSPRVFLMVASIAWIMPMAFALLWSLGPLLPEPVLTSFGFMLRAHASVQTFGLVLCGLIGVLLATPTSDLSSTTPTIDITPKEARDDVAHPTNA
jgi:hypothetical protein